MDQEEQREIGKIAAIRTDEQIRERAHELGLTDDKVFQRIVEGLDAMETKAFCTKAGYVVYSEEMVAHGVRMKAVQLARDILRLKPADRQEIDVNSAKTISVDEPTRKLISETIKQIALDVNNI